MSLFASRLRAVLEEADRAPDRDPEWARGWREGLKKMDRLPFYLDPLVWFRRDLHSLEGKPGSLYWQGYRQSYLEVAHLIGLWA